MRLLFIIIIWFGLLISPSQATPKQSYYAIQIFVTQFYNKARGLKKDWIERKNYVAQIVPKNKQYIVLVGKFSTRMLAEKQLNKIKANNSDNPLILGDKQIIKFFNGKKWAN